MFPNKWVSVVLLGLASSVLANEQSSDIVNQNNLLLQQLAHQVATAEEAEKTTELANTEQADSTVAVETAVQQISQYVDKDTLIDANLIAKIYAERAFQPIWRDASAKQLFLQEYALLAVSKLAPQIVKNLNNIESAVENPQKQDILLTNAFLDYLYFTDGLKKNGQTWLYSKGSYKSGVPSESRVAQWLEAVSQGSVVDFLKNMAQPNKRYTQTVQGLLNFIDQPDVKAETLAKLAVNIQRLRVIPEFEQGLFVNIPSYHLEYYRDGKKVLTSRVIVGKQARKTPVMYSKLSNIVVNPPWNAPVRLINEDLIPKVRKDPSYIYRNGYTIIDSKGKTIDPYTIDWENMTAKKFPYRLRQAPGGDSALGNYKFNMPSSEAIYLHDTPSRGLFQKKNRALSSGCVRVEKSDELATLLLNEAGWSTDKKSQVLKSQKTTSVGIRSDNPVYLYYVTAWVEEGKVKTLADIYDYDKGLTFSAEDKRIIKQYLL